MANDEFYRIKRLPPYVFNIVTELKMAARKRGEDIIDFGMGNPDQPTPKHIVDKLIEAAQNPRNHRYSASKGIYKLRLAISDWYKRRYNVDIDPDGEAVATIGSKEGLAHMALAIVEPGDVVFVPNPTYSIHTYSVVIAGGDVRSIPLLPGVDFFDELLKATKQTWPKPKLLILNFPHNPTAECVDKDFFVKVVDFAKENNLMVIHDLAYADIVFDGYKAPSFLEVPGAKDVGVEIFTLSKSYNMPGWRVGFAVGNKRIISALTRMKSYLDYGMFQPIQIAAVIALNGPQDCVKEICSVYESRRNVLIESFGKAGWDIQKPKATMFVWAKIPEHLRHLRSLEFSKFLLEKAKVSVSPGIGFGEYGDDYVRLALVENEHRIRQAAKCIKKALEIPKNVKA
ncbi:MAG: alanine transaminase [Deltaproteobacteria bacterium]|nr:alanine transaminase [Deltaproteobacteria bacterium]